MIPMNVPQVLERYLQKRVDIYDSFRMFKFRSVLCVINRYQPNKESLRTCLLEFTSTGIANPTLENESIQIDVP